MLKRWFAIPLWQRVIGALILGIIAGLFWGEGAESIKWIGDLFIRAIKMLVVPLIFFSLVSGVTAIGDLKKLGAVGGRAIGLFLFTGAASVILGLTMGTFLAPGSDFPPGLAESVTVVEPEKMTLTGTILGVVPDNIIQTMATGDVLPLITFALLFGMGILLAGKDGASMARAMDSGAIVMQKMTLIVMELTPFGVFALIAWVAGSFGIDALLPLAKVVGLNYVGCGLIIFGIYGIVLKVFTKSPLIDFYRGIVDAQAVAFSTASSNATLPVTLRCAQRNLGVSRSVSSFVISLGATINMNGTAMYLG
ncbi:MAG: dicarboxylate/amino acid:cation symporter, partial [Pseudomonadota bacterium]